MPPKKILIAPLDWGLGHATRCIPIIQEFLNRRCEVQIASSGRALALLKQEFAALRFHELVSYDAHYSKTFPLAVSLFFQVPKFLGRIKEEHRQIERIVRDEQIEVVISDNRYGCWSAQVPSVFITHQVNILMPRVLRWMEPWVNHFNHQLIRRFSACWVPDEPHDRITGKMTASRRLKVTYIGMLSRFEKIEVTARKYDLLVLLSGPEPQRTRMEREILKKLTGSPLKVLVVRGIPGEPGSRIESNDNIVQINHLNAKELNLAMAESEVIFSRSGYSTLMDLSRLNKKAIFIPTPGQTEQEYLARQLEERKIVYTTSLAKLDLNKAMALSAGYAGFRGPHNPDLLVKTINELLQ